MSVIDDALRSMSQRLEEVEHEADELRTAIAALENGRARPTTARRDGASRATPARPAARKRAARGENRSKILDAIKRKAKTASEIEVETGIAAATAASTLHALVKAGLAKKAARGYMAVR